MDKYWASSNGVAATPEPCFAEIEETLADLRAGTMIVVVDDEHRENEGDLVLAAQFATPNAINFMIKKGRGLVCLALDSGSCKELELEPMPTRNHPALDTAFMVSIDAREDVTTGVSAYDRARTIQVAIDPHSGPGDLVRPGHVFPLKAKPGGVLERAGHTEAAVDLARLAGRTPAAVICEILNQDGTMARKADLAQYCARHRLKMITVADLIAFKRYQEQPAEELAATR